MMEPTNTPIVFLVAIAATSFAVVILVLLIAKNRIRDSRLEKAAQVNKQAIQEFLETGKVESARKIGYSRHLAEYLNVLGPSLSGIHKQRFLTLYHHFGFQSMICRDLASRRTMRITSALGIARSLDLRISDQLFIRLINHNNSKIRWATLEFASYSKPNKLFFPIMSALSDSNRHLDGLSQMVINNLLKHAPKQFYYLTEMPLADHLSLATLKTLALSPTPEANKFILKSMRRSSSEEDLVAGMNAILACPDTVFLDSILLLSQHPYPVIRVLVAQALRDYKPEAKIDGVIAKLTRDPDSRVRSRALETQEIYEKNRTAHEVVVVQAVGLAKPNMRM